MKEYSQNDALLSIEREATDAENKQHFRKAEQLRKYAAWLKGGCIGREPSLKKYKGA